MNVRYTHHGREQCRRRRVAEDDILTALGDYVLSRPGDDGAIVYEGPKQDGRALTVVLLPPGLTDAECTVVVKTVWWRTEEGD